MKAEDNGLRICEHVDMSKCTNSVIYVSLITTSFVMRGTTAIFWLPLVIYHAMLMYRDRMLVEVLFKKLIINTNKKMKKIIFAGNGGSAAIASHMAIDNSTNGRMPAIGQGKNWYDTPNIHLCTMRDFAELCVELDLRVERAVSLNEDGVSREFRHIGLAANLRGEQGIFLLAHN